jgi:hypothetical protein
MKPVSAFQLASVEKRVAFLSELLHGASASLAAARADLNRGSVYRWRLTDPEFAAVWAEIVASRPRPRHLRRRVLGKAPGFESSGVSPADGRPRQIDKGPQ